MPTITKKRLIIGFILLTVVGLVVLIGVMILIAVLFGGLFNQAASQAGQVQTDGLFGSLGKAANDFLQSLWQQVLANPLQLLMGG